MLYMLWYILMGPSQWLVDCPTIQPAKNDWRVIPSIHIKHPFNGSRYRGFLKSKGRYKYLYIIHLNFGMSSIYWTMFGYLHFTQPPIRGGFIAHTKPWLMWCFFYLLPGWGPIFTIYRACWPTKRGWNLSMPLKCGYITMIVYINGFFFEHL